MSNNRESGANVQRSMDSDSDLDVVIQGRPPVVIVIESTPESVIRVAQRPQRRNRRRIESSESSAEAQRESSGEVRIVRRSQRRPRRRIESSESPPVVVPRPRGRPRRRRYPSGIVLRDEIPVVGWALAPQLSLRRANRPPPIDVHARRRSWGIRGMPATHGSYMGHWGSPRHPDYDI